MTYRILFSYFLTLPFFVALDMLYQWQFDLLTGDMDWYALSAFYVIYTLALSYFAIFHGFSRQSLPITAFSGALFGAFTYATYGLVTMSVLPDLPLSVIFLDMVRGAVISGVVATIGHFINQAVLNA